MRVDVCFGGINEVVDLHNLDAPIGDDLVVLHKCLWNVVWQQWSAVESWLVVLLCASVVWLVKIGIAMVLLYKPGWCMPSRSTEYWGYGCGLLPFGRM